MSSDLCLVIENAYSAVLAVPCDDVGYRALIDSTKAVVQSAGGGGSLNIPLLQLTPQEGQEIAMAILSVWALGWCIRQLVRLIQTSDASPSKESE